MLRWCRRLWFLRVLSLVTFGGHGFWLGHHGLCNFCVQRRTRTYSDGWFVLSNFFSPLSAIFRFVSKFVGSPSLSPWRRRRFWGVSCGWDMMDYGSAFGSREISSMQRNSNISDAYCSAATASRELKRVKENLVDEQGWWVIFAVTCCCCRRRRRVNCCRVEVCGLSLCLRVLYYPLCLFVLFACLVSLGLWWDFFWLGHDGSRNRSQHHVFFCVYRRFFAHMAACRGFESVERIRSNKGVKCTWG